MELLRFKMQNGEDVWIHPARVSAISRIDATRFEVFVVSGHSFIIEDNVADVVESVQAEIRKSGGA
jgi:uncharacterized protein YlzI (FlbEa/FlbD family)